MLSSMRFILAPALLLACTATHLVAQNRTIRRLDGSSISTSDAESIAAAELTADHVTGAQLAILNHGHLVWSHAFGLRDTEHQLPMTTDTNIWAASVTKGVFATWVMRLVEQHRLNLDQPVARILPLPLDQYPAFHDSAAELVLDPQWQHVTPRMLLSHTSGLANLALIEPGHKLRLHFTPGSRYAYSGDGLNILQLAIEERLHLSLAEAMNQDIFIPLDMTRTGLVWRPDFDTNVALRYDATGKFISATHRLQARAAGSMATTVHDLALFLEALLANRILSRATRAQMLTPQIAIHSAHEFPAFDPATGNDGEQFGLAYGLGWGLLPRTPYGPAFFKEGHGDGAENYVICFERSGSCMILLTNSDNGELAFQPLLEKLLGDTVTPWQWELYTRDQILHNEEHSH